MDDHVETEKEPLAQRLANESFRHSWDTTDERRIDGEWVHGLCCDCGEFVPFGEEVAHLAEAFERVLSPTSCDSCDDTGRVPWMVEGDPNCHQEPDDDGQIPCLGCRPSRPGTAEQPCPHYDHRDPTRCGLCAGVDA